MKLAHSIRVLKGMGPKTADHFIKHGIVSLEDLLTFFPRAWHDARTITPIGALRGGSSFVIEATVVRVQEGRSQKTRMPYLRALMTDATGSLEVLWFNASYLKQVLKPDKQFLLYGLVQGWQTDKRIMMAPRFLDKPTILPIYSEIGGVSSAKIQTFIRQLESSIPELEDYLPPAIARRLGVLSRHDTVARMHFAETMDDLLAARKRLGFDELIMIAAPSLLAEEQRQQEVTDPLAGKSATLQEWQSSLPFALTNDQKEAIATIVKDIGLSKPMNRLLQGDVGSGKTVVALAAALQAINAGKQVVWLAPTELLAEQHFGTTQKLLLGCAPVKSIGLLTRSLHKQSVTGQESKETKEVVCQSDLVIGTHALLGEGLTFPRLGLLVIDEQHRFGVKQRAQLRHMAGKPVHLLSMTATPIPRTMALLLYGDLELSVIKEKPLGRKPVTTRVVSEANRAKAYAFIDAHVAHGEQVYVVCPLIEPPEDKGDIALTSLFDTIEEKKAVTQWQQEIQRQFPLRRVGLLHGKLKPVEKQSVMESFRKGEINILVTTSVIEVGVDVPNATIMVIENAERFGLAQLHQLRGRVGRSDVQSFCFLFPSSAQQQDNARLATMEETNDGFVLAQKDLELRGPGQITGLVQSGMPELRFASFDDMEQMQTIKDIARELLSDPQFEAFVQRFWRTYHPE